MPEGVGSDDFFGLAGSFPAAPAGAITAIHVHVLTGGERSRELHPCWLPLTNETLHRRRSFSVYKVNKIDKTRQRRRLKILDTSRILQNACTGIFVHHPASTWRLLQSWLYVNQYLSSEYKVLSYRTTLPPTLSVFVTLHAGTAGCSLLVLPY